VVNLKRFTGFNWLKMVSKTL